MTKRPQISTDPDAWMMGRTSPSGEWDADAGRFVNVRPAKRRAAPPLEAPIQRAIIDRLRWLGILAVHIPNEGKREATTGARLKGEGMRPGFPDLAVYQDGKHALLEVKRPGWKWAKPGTKAAKRQENQRECHAELARQGFVVAVVTSQDEAVAALRERGFRL